MTQSGLTKFFRRMIFSSVIAAIVVFTVVINITNDRRTDQLWTTSTAAAATSAEATACWLVAEEGLWHARSNIAYKLRAFVIVDLARAPLQPRLALCTRYVSASRHVRLWQINSIDCLLCLQDVYCFLYGSVNNYTYCRSIYQTINRRSQTQWTQKRYDWKCSTPNKFGKQNSQRHPNVVKYLNFYIKQMNCVGKR